jgi:cytoskeleton protein RodZ
MSDVEAKANQRAAAPAAAGRTPAPLPGSAGDGNGNGNGSGNGSFGRALAAAREARGLSQAEVAAQLRLNVRQVQAIEAEDLAALPEGPFVRGYVRNFARVVDLPAEPLLALLNARLKPTDPLHAEGTAAVSPLQRAPSEPHTSRLVIGGVIVALAVFAAFGWWTMRRPPSAPATVQAPAPAPAPEPTPPPAPAATVAAAAPADAPAAVAAPADTALRFTFRDRSWVEVRQADGAVLTSQNNAAGTTQTVDGVPPYTLTVGNASKVELQYRGQPVDLAAQASRDDVARLRLE